MTRPLTGPELCHLEHATHALADALRRLRAAEAAGHFTCDEAEAIADVLRIVDPDLADEWMEGHALGDDDIDDRHHQRWHELTRPTLPCQGGEPLPTKTDISSTALRE